MDATDAGQVCRGPIKRQRRSELVSKSLGAPALALVVAKLMAHEPDLHALVFKLCQLQWANVDRRSFDSAEMAFAALNGDTAMFSRLAKATMREVEIASISFEIRNWRGYEIHLPRARSMRDQFSRLFDARTLARLTTKSWKVVKLRGSNHVCFYSDAYRCELGTAHMLASACGRAKLDVRIFEWDYPRLQFANGYFPPKSTRVLGWGYNQLFRGKLVGFVVGPRFL